MGKYVFSFGAQACGKLGELLKLLETKEQSSYVIDRLTGEKSFEQMSIYVRLG